MTSSALVFIVENEEAIRSLLEEALTVSGFDVAVAATGEEAMAMLKTNATDYSVLIIDINLGGELSGWEVAKRTREISDRLPVIYISGSNPHNWVLRRVPNSQFMLKPFTLARLITSISQLIDTAETRLRNEI